MTKYEDVTAAFAALDTATTSLGARVQALIDEINRTASDGLNGPQTEAVLANLATLKTGLDGMGANANAPFPTVAAAAKIPGPYA